MLLGIGIMLWQENIAGVCVALGAALVSTINAEIVRKSGCIVHPITRKPKYFQSLNAFFFFLVVVFGNFLSTIISLILELLLHGITIPSELEITVIVVLSLCFFIGSIIGIKAWEY